MRLIALAALVTCFFSAEPVSATDALNIYTDNQRTSCLITDVAPGPISLYVFHENTPEAVWSRFRVVADEGFTAVFVSHSVPPGFLYLGEPMVDYTVSYGGCWIGTFLVTTLVFDAFGTSEPCARVWLDDAPSSYLPGELLTSDCTEGLKIPVTNGPAVANYIVACPAWCIVATETSTWGSVKALYR